MKRQVKVKENLHAAQDARKASKRRSKDTQPEDEEDERSKEGTWKEVPCKKTKKKEKKKTGLSLETSQRGLEGNERKKKNRATQQEAQDILQQLNLASNQPEWLWTPEQE